MVVTQPDLFDALAEAEQEALDASRETATCPHCRRSWKAEPGQTAEESVAEHINQRSVYHGTVGKCPTQKQILSWLGRSYYGWMGDFYCGWHSWPSPLSIRLTEASATCSPEQVQATLDEALADAEQARADMGECPHCRKPAREEDMQPPGPDWRGTLPPAHAPVWDEETGREICETMLALRRSARLRAGIANRGRVKPGELSCSDYRQPHPHEHTRSCLRWTADFHALRATLAWGSDEWKEATTR